MYLTQGKATEAGPLITRAVQLAPYDPNMLDTLAAVQAMLGRCTEAVSTQARAVDALPDGTPPPARRRDFESRLREVPDQLCLPRGLCARREADHTGERLAARRRGARATVRAPAGL